MRSGEEIPPAVRAEVYERDQNLCRICGRYTDTPGLHHIVYRSQGGQHIASNLVVVGWTPGHDCHLEVAHGPQARLFRTLLLVCAERPGITALGLRRQLALKRKAP